MLFLRCKAPFCLVLLMVFLLVGQSQATTWSVNKDGSADYITIQEAIDVALDGDTIQIALGHYVEQLVIENMLDISFVGSGSGMTYLDSPHILAQSYDLNGYPQFPVVLISNCDGINFSNLTLDGRDKGLGNVPFHGFGYFDSGGTIEDVHVTGMREDPVSYELHGNGMLVVTFDGGPHDMILNHILADDVQKTGILLHGLGLTSTSTNVQVVGQGPIVAPVQNGWQVSGQAQLTATGCLASDISNLNSVYVATGMLGITDTKMTLTNCDFDACDVGLYAIGNTAVYTGGLVTNPVLNGIMGKSFANKTELDDLPAQPLVIGSELATADGALDITLTDITLLGIDEPTSWGVAILSDNQIHVEIDNVDISHFAMGLVTYEGYGVLTGQTRNCNFFDNVLLSAFSNTAVPFDARYNDWGDPSGPFHPDTNPTGLGNRVYDFVRYSPFNGGGGVIITPELAGPVACGESVVFTVTYVAGPTTPDLFLYNIEIRGGEGLNTPNSPVSFNPWGGTEQFLHYDNDDGSYTVTGSTVGGNPQPLVGPGSYDLFTIEISAYADSGGVAFLEDVTLRGPSNNTIPTTISFSEFYADCAAPAPVSGISVAPHHNRTAVSWIHDSMDVDHYEVFSGLWHDGAHASVYPEYDDVVGNTIPTRPADYAEIIANALGEWVPLGNAAVLSMDEIWSDSSKRGVYYYEVFAVDAVGNVSPVAAETNAATNYWLGDVPPFISGTVDVMDMTTLGDALGESAGDANYDSMTDVGPTDDWRSTGIPTTDDSIDFEDLMVFSMNFGVVSGINKNQDHLSGTVRLSWVEAGEGKYALRLVEGDGIKGVRVRANLPTDNIGVTAGQLLDDQDEMTFLKNIGHGLDVNVAVMGQGNGFDGTGDLFIVTTSRAIAASSLEITVRGHDNSEIQVSLDESSGVVTPRVFALRANHPNPFNPKTKISFSLPEAQDVRLNVYAIDGSKVATLINEVRNAGLHEVIWSGRDEAGQAVASGTYFYRIEAGPHSQVRKMTLMK